MDFSEGTNIIYGDNAQGKTNILEAIYVAATTKSHKGSKDKEIINFDKEEAQNIRQNPTIINDIEENENENKEQEEQEEEQEEQQQ